MAKHWDLFWATVYHEIHGHICKRHDFEIGDWEVFNAMHNALHYEPQCLEEDKGLGKPVAFTPVLDFRLCQHGECVDIVMIFSLLCTISHLSYLLFLSLWTNPIKLDY